MPKKLPLTALELAVIEEHSVAMIGHCTTAIVKLSALPKLSKTPEVMAQIQYWKNARSGLNWSLGIARQRCPGVKPNA